MFKKIWLLSIFIVVIIVNVLFNTFYDIYSVSSGSMLPTIKPGDYLLIKKNKKIINNCKDQNKIDIVRGKIYVFALPAMKSNMKYFAGEANSLYVKRCVGIPGDTLQFIKQDFKINSQLVREYSKNSGNSENNNSSDKINNIYDLALNYYYPHDLTYLWDSNNCGPLYIPEKNTKIQLTASLKILYNDIILYETENISNNKVLAIDEYIFKKDYYYFVGDNLYGSTDSRHWGMIPKENIIGEVNYILWSKSESSFFKGIRWGRIIKRLD